MKTETLIQPAQNFNSTEDYVKQFPSFTEIEKKLNNYDSLLAENKSVKVDYEFANEMKNEYQKKVQQLEAVNDSLLSALEELVTEHYRLITTLMSCGC